MVFVNTSPPEDRVKLLKSFNDIKEMEDDSEEIYASGLLDRYTKHPAKLPLRKEFLEKREFLGIPNNSKTCKLG